MKRTMFSFLRVLCAAALCVFAGCASSGGGSSPRSGQSAAPVYWSGDGGSNIRLAILVPDGRGLASDQGYLPAMVQWVP
ncbi:hypothetical protein FACS189491_04720 [Spirochaetia bacterium]|nr:hypothetical protein FACS189491_04720 [Spirochaetia bacterium]